MANSSYLESIASEFRKALDLVVDERKYGRLRIFARFPDECCQYTSDLLAEYMMNKGISRNSIQMVTGETIEDKSRHCWLLIDKAYFVDITADQLNGKVYFEEYEPIPECLVVPRDVKYLYERFDNNQMQVLNDVGISTYSGEVPMNLQVVYNAVIQKIDESKEEK